MVNEDNQEIAEIRPENETARGGSRPRWRIPALLAFAVLAGILEYYVHFGFARYGVRLIAKIDFNVGLRFGLLVLPLIGAVVAGAALGFVLRLRSLKMHLLVFVIMLLVARTATLYMDFIEFRENRIAGLVAEQELMDNIALLKLAMEGHNTNGIILEDRRSIEVYETDMKQRGLRADFLGYLRLLFCRGLRDVKGNQFEEPWIVAVFLLASTLALGAACFIISKPVGQMHGV